MTFTEVDARFITEFATETATQKAARALAHEHGVHVIPAATGAHYAIATATTRAASILEVGTGFGVSGLWLLRGSPGAVLTSIDEAYDRQEPAKALFVEAGVSPNHLRLITGKAEEVLTRMNEEAYDVVVVDGDPADVLTLVDLALRVIRPGGQLLVPHVLWHGETSDPTKRGAIPGGFRKVIKRVEESDTLIGAVTPLADGLLTVVKTA